MATRKQIQHYMRLAREMQAQVDARVHVEEIVQETADADRLNVQAQMKAIKDDGIRVTDRGSLALASFKPSYNVPAAPFNDVWGDAR